MRKILVIAAREYRAAVQSKAFIISLVVMPLMMGGGILVQKALQGMGDTKVKRFAVVDRTPGEQIFPFVEMAAKATAKDPGRFQAPVPGEQRVRLNNFQVVHVAPGKDDPAAIKQQRFELSEKVRRGELFGFAEIGPDVERIPDALKKALPRAGTGPKALFGGGKDLKASLEDDKGLKEWFKSDRASVRYQTNSPTYMAFPVWLQVVVNEVVRAQRSQAEGLNPLTVQLINLPVKVETRGLSEKNKAGVIEEAPSQNLAVSFGVPFGLAMLMFMVIMIGASPLIQGIIEEKMQRIAEVLLGSVRPFDLMLGKLLGMVGVSLTLAAVYLGGAYWAADHFGFAQYLTPDLIAWFLVFQTMAVLMYGSIFIAVGAACSDMKETQTLLTPVMLIVMIPLFVMSNVIQDPGSSFAFWVSLFPFATPMLMIARQAVPPHLPLWEPLLGVAVVLATTVLFVYVAGRIFRVGILMQGKGARLREMARWVFRG